MQDEGWYYHAVLSSSGAVDVSCVSVEDLRKVVMQVQLPLDGGFGSEESRNQLIEVRQLTEFILAIHTSSITLCVCYAIAYDQRCSST